MPLKRAEALVHLDPDFNIVFPMRDKTSNKLVECCISLQSLSEVYGAPPGEEIVTFGANRAAIEAAASAEYDRRHACVAAVAGAKGARGEFVGASAMMATAGAAVAVVSGDPALAAGLASVAAAILCI